MNRVIGQINANYDQVMYSRLAAEYWEYSDFLNLGLWHAHTTSQKQACENLMGTLLSLIPSKKGRILDVACGKGATTRHLLRYYSPSKVVGINISEKQLARCRQNAPACRFTVMDATRLGFEDRTFQAVISVE